MADNYWVPMRLPSPKEIAKYALWGTGRVMLSGWLFGLHGITVVCKVTINVAEMTRLTTLQLLKVYDQLPYMGASVQNILDVSATTVTEEFDIITDIVAATVGKQVMVIGEMGTGKSTIAQYLAYTVGGRVKVYEFEGTLRFSVTPGNATRKVKPYWRNFPAFPCKNFRREPGGTNVSF